MSAVCFLLCWLTKPVKFNILYIFIVTSSVFFVTGKRHKSKMVVTTYTFVFMFLLWKIRRKWKTFFRNWVYIVQTGDRWLSAFPFLSSMCPFFSFFISGYSHLNFLSILTGNWLSMSNVFKNIFNTYVIWYVIQACWWRQALTGFRDTDYRHVTDMYLPILKRVTSI